MTKVIQQLYVRWHSRFFSFFQILQYIYHSKKKKNTPTKQYYSVCTITIITGSSCLDFICKTHTSIIKLFFSLEKWLLTWIFFSTEPHEKKTLTHTHATPRASIALIFLTICNTFFSESSIPNPTRKVIKAGSPHPTEGHQSNIRDRSNPLTEIVRLFKRHSCGWQLVGVVGCAHVHKYTPSNGGT